MQETKMIISKSFNEAIKEAEQLLIPNAKINNLTISKDEIFNALFETYSNVVLGKTYTSFNGDNKTLEKLKTMRCPKNLIFWAMQEILKDKLSREKCELILLSTLKKYINQKISKFKKETSEKGTLSTHMFFKRLQEFNNHIEDITDWYFSDEFGVLANINKHKDFKYRLEGLEDKFQVIENKIKMLEENIYKKTSKGK